jgi:1,4-alpha-glucan branching enzyme
MTFGLVYAFSERFVLPLSHDEVVYGKGSLYERAPGDSWQKLATLRAYFTFMWTHPGKKLLFMGGEIGQPAEWNHDGQVDWERLGDPLHAGLQRLVADLNGAYSAEPALHATDAEPWGFDWIVGDDSENSVFAYLRRGPDESTLLTVINMTPVPRAHYRIGVPHAGFWREIFNSDAPIYGGAGIGNPPGLTSQSHQAHGHGQSIASTLPPLGALIFKHGG